MVDALAAKNSEIEALVSSMEALKKQAAISEGNLASMQANMDAIMRNRELIETRMMQALREELTSVERRAEEERVAHNATKMADMEKEVELEHRALEASTALARTHEHMELEKRYRDLTDLLYYKQTQLENMASEKDVAEFQLEKELKRLQEAQVETERSRAPRRASAYWVEDTEMKALEDGCMDACMHQLASSP